MTDRELMQMANRIEALAFEMKAPNANTPQFVMLANEIRARARLSQPEPEPVAWRTFDGENGYEYRDYETNESYASEWAQRNPNHKGWVEPLYKDPTPCQTCESLARTVMMDQVSYDAPPRHREPPTQDLSAPLTVNGVPMYPQREWQGLTRKQLLQIWGKPENFNDPMRFARAIEAALKAKNAIPSPR